MRRSSAVQSPDPQATPTKQLAPFLQYGCATGNALFFKEYPLHALFGLNPTSTGMFRALRTFVWNLMNPQLQVANAGAQQTEEVEVVQQVELQHIVMMLRSGNSEMLHKQASSHSTTLAALWQVLTRQDQNTLCKIFPSFIEDYGTTLQSPPQSPPRSPPQRVRSSDAAPLRHSRQEERFTSPGARSGRSRSPSRRDHTPPSSRPVQTPLLPASYVCPRVFLYYDNRIASYTICINYSPISVYHENSFLQFLKKAFADSSTDRDAPTLSEFPDTWRDGFLNIKYALEEYHLYAHLVGAFSTQTATSPARVAASCLHKYQATPMADASTGHTYMEASNLTFHNVYTGGLQPFAAEACDHKLLCDRGIMNAIAWMLSHTFCASLPRFVTDYLPHPADCNESHLSSGDTISEYTFDRSDATFKGNGARIALFSTLLQSMKQPQHSDSLPMLAIVYTRLYDTNSVTTDPLLTPYELEDPSIGFSLLTSGRNDRSGRFAHRIAFNRDGAVVHARPCMGWIPKNLENRITTSASWEEYSSRKRQVVINMPFCVICSRKHSAVTIRANDEWPYLSTNSLRYTADKAEEVAHQLTLTVTYTLDGEFTKQLSDLTAEMKKKQPLTAGFEQVVDAMPMTCNCSFAKYNAYGVTNNLIQIFQGTDKSYSIPYENGLDSDSVGYEVGVQTGYTRVTTLDDCEAWINQALGSSASGVRCGLFQDVTCQSLLLSSILNNARSVMPKVDAFVACCALFGSTHTLRHGSGSTLKSRTDFWASVVDSLAAIPQPNQRPTFGQRSSAAANNDSESMTDFGM